MQDVVSDFSKNFHFNSKFVNFSFLWSEIRGLNLKAGWAVFKPDQYLAYFSLFRIRGLFLKADWKTRPEYFIILCKKVVFTFISRLGHTCRKRAWRLSSTFWLGTNYILAHVSFYIGTLALIMTVVSFFLFHNGFKKIEFASLIYGQITFLSTISQECF